MVKLFAGTDGCLIDIANIRGHRQLHGSRDRKPTPVAVQVGREPGSSGPGYFFFFHKERGDDKETN